MRNYVKMRPSIVLVAIAVNLSLVLIWLPHAAAQVLCPGAANAPNSAQENLDHTKDDWGVYCENAPTWRMRNVPSPSVDGEALECAITGGEEYSNVHCYRNLLSEPDAALFTLDMLFWFSGTSCNNSEGVNSVVQALEFTMNKWYQGKRYEFAVQWQNVGPGAPQWRYWDPSKPDDQRWVAFDPPIRQCLQGGDSKQHSFRMEGAIVNEQVELHSFTIDGTTHNVNLTIPPIVDAGAPDLLAVAVQVDGNSQQKPYSLFVDRVDFMRWPAQLSLTAPDDGAIFPTSQPTLVWDEMPGAIHYEVQLDTKNPPTITVADVATLNYTPPAPLPADEYFWRIRAIDGAGHASPWSPSRCFMVQSLTTGAPLINLLRSYTPTLTWNPITWATEYELQVDDSPSFKAPVEYSNAVDALELEDTTSPLRGCTHYWRVRAKGDDNRWGAWSSATRFFVSTP